MKKNIWAGIHKLLRMGLLSYVLLLCSFSGIAGVAVTHAKSSLCILLCGPTPTPTPTPTPQPTSAPTPRATQPPQATPPPQVQPNPTTGMHPRSTVTAETPTPATPTSTPVSATATAVTVTPNQTTTATSTDSTPANQQSQGAEDTGSNILIPSLLVGIPLFLLIGVMLWFLWRRQKKEHKPVLQGIFHNAQAPRWISSREIPSAFDASLNTSPAVFGPEVSGASGGAGVLPMPGSQPMLSPQLAYTSSDPYSMMTASPQPMVTTPLNNAPSYSQNGSLQSLLTGSLNQPLQLTEAGELNKNGHMFPPADVPMALIDTPTQSMSLSQVESAVSPPSAEDDPMLGAVIRQAQMGLFAPPRR